MLDLTDRNGKKDIKSMTLEEVTAELGTLGEKPFRAKQLYDWLHVKLVTDFDQMSTLSKSLRERLKEHYSVTALKVVGERISAVDGTRKYLFGLEDGNVIESVWMKYHHGNSVCISSQVGAVWAAASAPPPWTVWSGTCGPQKCWIRFIGSRPLQESGYPMW